MKNVYETSSERSMQHMNVADISYTACIIRGVKLKLKLMSWRTVCMSCSYCDDV